jgi:hypothetical protein
MKANAKKYSAWLKLCTVKTNEVVRVNKATQVNIGQGDGDTRWKGWAWKFLRLKFVIFFFVFFSFYINI